MVATGRTPLRRSRTDTQKTAIAARGPSALYSNRHTRSPRIYIWSCLAGTKRDEIRFPLTLHFSIKSVFTIVVKTTTMSCGDRVFLELREFHAEFFRFRVHVRMTGVENYYILSNKFVKKKLRNKKGDNILETYTFYQCPLIYWNL